MGFTVWLCRDLAGERVLAEPAAIAAFIRSEPATPRHCAMDRAALSELRKRVEKQVVNDYLRPLQAPVGVTPILLWRVNADGDWRSWVLFFLHGVAEQARDASARAKRLQDLQAEWRTGLMGARSSTILLRLMDELFRTPIITLPQVQRILAVTHRSATLAVERLIDEGLLELVPGRMRNRQYVARQILDIVGDESL